MKNLKLMNIILSCLVFTVVLLSSCGTGSSRNRQNINPGYLKIGTVSNNGTLSNNGAAPKDGIVSNNGTAPKDGTASKDGTAPKDGTGISTVPDSKTNVSSGTETTVPWEDDSRFLKAKEQTGASIMMAAYRTVLRDPLPGEEYNVHLAADMLAGIVIYPGEVFSQNQKIGPYTEARGFQKGPTYLGTRLTTTIGGGVCKIASTLYNVIILSNLQVVERQCHSMPVPYVPYGQDATVAYGVHDLKFRNNTDFPVLIWARGVDNILYIAFYGQKSPPEVVWHHEMTDVQKAPIVYRKNASLSKGTEKTILEGMNGATVRSWLTVKNPDGIETVKNLGISYYRPMAYIIEKGE